MADYRAGFHLIPAHMHEGVARWIEQGLPPGSFLWAVVCNDLVGAVAQADEANRMAIVDWVTFFYNFAPSACFGSSAKAQAWMTAHTKDGHAETHD